MAGFGIFGTKKKAASGFAKDVNTVTKPISKEPLETASMRQEPLKKVAKVAKKGVGGVDSTGYTKAQKKALKTGGKSKALSAVDKRRKAMAEVMGN